MVAACFDEPVRGALRGAARREEVFSQEYGNQYNHIQRYPGWTAVALVVVSLSLNLAIGFCLFNLDDG